MFITIDGPDGTGKTTLARGLADRLSNEHEIPALYTSEPTDTELGKYIRRLLHDGGEDLRKLSKLFVKDRERHIQNVILPESKAGKVVICDRYKYSTVCYQHIQGEPIQLLIDMNKRFVSPDIAFILKVSNSDILLDRITKRGLEKDLFERREFLEESIKLYSSMKRYYPNDNIVFIDAEGSPEHILEQILSRIVDKANSGNLKVTFDQAYSAVPMMA